MTLSSQDVYDIRFLSRQADLLVYEVQIAQVAPGAFLPQPPVQTELSVQACLDNLTAAYESIAEDWKPGGNRNPRVELYTMTRAHAALISRIEKVLKANEQ